MIDTDSVTKICPNYDHDQMMVYGWKHCDYGRVINALRPSVKLLFDYQIGNPLNCISTLEGRIFEKIKGNDTNLPTKCKNALVHMVLENYKRKKEGRKLIPIIFCTEVNTKDTNYQGQVIPRIHQTSATTITSKEPSKNEKITAKELRRAYKLCCELADKEMQTVAQDTFKFVRVVQDPNGAIRLEQVSPPWEAGDWQESWAKRKTLSTKTKQKSDWRDQLSSAVVQFNSGSGAGSSKTAYQCAFEKEASTSELAIRLANEGRISHAVLKAFEIEVLDLRSKTLIQILQMARDTDLLEEAVLSLEPDHDLIFPQMARQLIQIGDADIAHALIPCLGCSEGPKIQQEIEDYYRQFSDSDTGQIAGAAGSSKSSASSGATSSSSKAMAGSL